MTTISLARRSDADIIALIHAHLSAAGPQPRTHIMSAAQIGIDASKRLLLEMEADGTVECYLGFFGPKRCTLYCIPATRPRPTAGPNEFKAAEILEGFREAVSAAYSAGNDPFKAAA